MKAFTRKKFEFYKNASQLRQQNFEKKLILQNVSDQEIYVDKFEYPGSKNKLVMWINSSIWTYVISPLFLLCLLFVYTTTPSKIFNKELRTVLTSSLNRYTKRLLDILGAISGLIICSVFFLIIAILIKLDSKGPVFYSQVRIGKNRRRKDRRIIDVDIHTERRQGDRRKNNFNGKKFAIYKFRTMREDAERKCGPVWASQNDPRITTIGKFLRYTHLDEIPQILNILKGEMSFVGPRPERPHFVNQFAEEIPGYVGRLSIKPGLTGLAQISHGYDDSIESVKIKLNYDLQYCRDGNIYSYFKIIVVTIHQTLFGTLKN